MDEIGPIESPMQTIEKPASVTVFGVLNIVFGCYSLERAAIFWSKYIKWMLSNPEEITSRTWITALYTFVFGPVFAVSMIVLGIGLLKMKNWARRGSIILGLLIIALTIYTVIAIFRFVSQLNVPVESWWAYIFNRENASMIIGSVYVVLLIVFMRSAKVKEAFRAIGG